jgi:predicted phage-related endonuclease
MAIIPIPESREEWLKLRQTYIGGSDVASLFGVQAGFTPSKFALWHMKRGAIEPDNLDDVERIRWGNLLEPVIGAEAAYRNGWAIEKGGFAIDDQCPRLATTLDFRIVSHQEAEFEGLGVLETKAVDYPQFKNDAWDLRPPNYIELQLQAQIAASGCSWGAIAALVSGNELHVWKRKARPGIIHGIRNRVTEFWASIETSVPPSVEGDGTDSTERALKALYAAPEREAEAEIPPDQLEEISRACMEFETERAARLAGVERETAAKNRLRDALKDANRARVIAPDPNSPTYLIKRDKRNAISVHQIQDAA